MWLGGDILPGLPHVIWPLHGARVWLGAPEVALGAPEVAMPMPLLVRSVAEVPIPKFLAGHRDITSFSLVSPRAGGTMGVTSCSSPVVQ